MKITFFELEPFEKKYFKEKLSHHKLTFVDSALSSRNAKHYADSDVIVIFIFSTITKKVLDKLPKLKFIATMSTGYNHIDTDYAKEKGIRVSSVPFYGQNTVAEHAFGLLQALNRHLVEAVTRTRNCEFDYKGLMGRDLQGKTLGVFGTGHIGQFMIRYAKAFGMNIVASDAHPNKSLAKTLGFAYMKKETVLKKADFISLHLPLLDSTWHYLGKKEFSLMKKGAILINTGRGPLIDTQALIHALDKGIVKGAALDVLEAENEMKKEARLALNPTTDPKVMKVCVQNHELLHRENVIITPHLAFYTHEAVQRILDTTIQNIKGHANKRYKNKVC